MNAIISASRLAGDLAGPNPPVVLDVRWQLGGPNLRHAYEEAHIPGAAYVDLDTELAAPAGAAGRHPLPDPEVFGRAMRAAGVSADRDVVVYDGGLGWAAARAWWLLRWTGHPSVRVLDGGFAAWSGPVEDGRRDVAAGAFVPAPGAVPLLDADGAASLARTGLLLDARAAERYRGDVEPIDRVGGHIPGAVSAPTTGNVAESGCFRPAGELADRFKALGADGTSEVGVYCGSGVSGAHEVLALAVAGIPAALYVGSWSEWSQDDGRPVATGPDPQ
ncbi:thiosulfate/3-mercaptopyruvate sulfurtransferase [Streptomyces aurantiacus]|uniref:sulfurtransferase n=1 Tax=Streptomyces aurantiacus TaxID=47760 RepID=UPI00279101A0|nr:sulfurtransferase [Streptomyces aurantiacus]MDQ0773976.1 thiosulfate/3-mercaptopyruvate sulfurtransferase [Streptomyces aurantiacus]